MVKSQGHVEKEPFVDRSDINKKLLLNFIDYHLKEVQYLNQKISDLGDKSIYLFGAHFLVNISKYLGLILKKFFQF